MRPHHVDLRIWLTTTPMCGREMYVELDHPQRGKWFNVGMPIKLSGVVGGNRAVTHAWGTYRTRY